MLKCVAPIGATHFLRQVGPVGDAAKSCTEREANDPEKSVTPS